MSGWFVLLGVKSVLVAFGLLGLGYLILDAVTRKSGLDSLMKWALSFAGLVAYALLLMVGHMATGGRVFSNVWLVRSISMILAVALIGRRIQYTHERLPRASRRDVLAACVVMALGLVLWGTLAFRHVPPSRAGADLTLHMGWASQLLNGETTPSAILTGEVPNYYPWMFHALVAFIAAFSPGGRAVHAVAPLQLMGIVGASLTLFVLGRVIGKTWLAGTATTFFGSMAVGVGISLLPKVNNVIPIPPTAGPRGSYNASYSNLHPPLPRDLGYILILAVVLLVLAAVVNKSLKWSFGAGIVLGLTGLSSPEAFLVGLVMALVVALLQRELGRLAIGGSIALPALAVYSIWLFPLVVNHFRLGGFVNTTLSRAEVLSPARVLISWGLATPLSVYALFRWLQSDRDGPERRVIVAFLLSATLMVFSSSALVYFHGERLNIVAWPPRYWPILYVGLALLAGVGFVSLVGRLAAWRKVAGRTLASAILVLAVAVPVKVNIDLLRKEHRGRMSHAVAMAILGQGSNFLTEVGRNGQRKCVVAAPPGTVSLLVFGYTGYRQVGYRGGVNQTRNFARIRWKDIYLRIGDERQRLADNRVLTTASGGRAEWRRVANKYAVNMIVTSRRNLAAFRHLLPRQVARLARRNEPFAVLFVRPCPHA
jgi:hypothetical protein